MGVRQDAERWLAVEHDQLDGEADVAFAQLFAALPAAEPAADFVEHVVAAAWQVRTRRRRRLAVVQTGASLALAVAGLFAYLAFGSIAGSIVGTGASVLSRSTIWLAGSIATGMEWWSVSALVADRATAVLATPQATAALIVMVFLGGAAFYALHRLLRDEVALPSSGPVCMC